MYFAGEDLSEGNGGVVERPAVDILMEVLYEDVPPTGSAGCRVPLRPHDSHLAALQCLVVDRLQRSLRCTTRQCNLLIHVLILILLILKLQLIER